jgi:hypothetical protein
MKKVFIVLSALLVTCMVFAVGFSPQIIEINLNKSNSAQLYLFNNSDKGEKYSLECVNNGSKGISPKTYIGNDIVIFPKQVFLPPKSSQKVTIYVKNADKFTTGEYFSSLIFQPMQAGFQPSNTQNSVGISFVTGTTIYVSKGKLTYSLDPMNTKIVTKKGRTTLEGTLKNTGNASMHLSIVAKNGSQTFKTQSVLFNTGSVNFSIPVTKYQKGKQYSVTVTDTDINKVLKTFTVK